MVCTSEVLATDTLFGRLKRGQPAFQPSPGRSRRPSTMGLRASQASNLEAIACRSTLLRCDSRELQASGPRAPFEPEPASRLSSTTAESPQPRRGETMPTRQPDKRPTEQEEQGQWRNAAIGNRVLSTL